MAVYLFILFMATTLTVGQLALAQDVDVRTGADKVSPDGGQSGRTVYAQRHLSPHRMMHFGKKAEQRQAAAFLEPFGYLPAPPPALQFRRLARRQTQAPPAVYAAAAGLTLGADNQLLNDGRPLLAQDVTRYALTQPVAIHLVTADGQELTSLPEGEDQLEYFIRSRGLLLPEGQFRFFDSTGKIQEKEAEILHKALEVTNDPAVTATLGGPRSMRLSKAEEKSGQNNGQNIEKVGEEQEEQQAGAAISLDTRSRKPNFARVQVPPQFMDKLYHKPGDFYGLPYMAFNKKAEPKDNLFMHFGRK